MGDEHHGVALPVQLLQHPQHLAAGVAVQRAGGLVGQNDRRVTRQSTCNGDTLLLAAGKLVGLVLELIAQPYPLKRGGSRGACAQRRGMPAYTSGTSTFSSRLSLGSRLYCWKMKPSISLRIAASSSWFILPTSRPLSR